MATERHSTTSIDFDSEFDGIVDNYDRPTEVMADGFDIDRFASNAFIKTLDLSETPIYADQSLLEDGYDLAFDTPDVVTDTPKRSVTETNTETEVKKPVTDTKEKVSRMKRIGKALGRIAVAPVKGVKRIDQMMSAAAVDVISKIPGSASKEEMQERYEALQDRFADYEEDSWLRLRYNALRRNQLKIMSYVPVTMMGAIAVEMFASRGLGYLGVAEHLSVHNMPLELAYKSTDVYIGGHTDNTGNLLVGGVQQAGLYNPNANNVNIDYSAQMGMMTGDAIPMNISDAEGGAKVADAIRNANGAPVRVFAFSQGTEAAIVGLRQIADENHGVVPSNVEVVLEGTPSGYLGLGQSNYTKGMSGSVLNMLGMETKQPIPKGAHITIRTDIADEFGNGGSQSGALLAEEAMGPGHRVVGPGNGVLISKFDKDGVTYEIWGDKDGVNNPIARMLRDNGVPITPEGERFAEALTPFTPPGSPTPVYANANEVSDSFAAMTDRAISDGTGTNLGIAQNIENTVMTPGRKADLQTGLNLEKIPDQMAQMQADPSTIPQNSQAIMGEVTGAINTGLKYTNPKELTGALNDGLRGAGIPITIPDNIVPAQAPAQRTQAPVYVAPARTEYAPTPAVAPATAVAPVIQGNFGGGNGLKPLLGALQNIVTAQRPAA